MNEAGRHYCPISKKHKIVMVEYTWSSPRHYDGVSELMCLTEKRRWGRWCGIELKEGESEPPFCTNKQNAHK